MCFTGSLFLCLLYNNVCLCVCVCICRYLINQGANVGVVNSEGETPLDIAEEEPMEELLKNEINRQGALQYISFFSSRWSGDGK